MKTYKISSQGFRKVRRRIIGTGILFMLVGLGSVVGFKYLKENLGDEPDPTWSNVITIPLIATAFGSGIWLSLKQSKKTLDSIQITVSHDFIARQQLRVSELRIDRADVTAIVETRDGLSVYTADRFRCLAVPTLLDPTDYENIKTTLATWKPIEQPNLSASLNSASGALLYFLSLGVLVFTGSLWLVILSSAFILGYNIYAWQILQKLDGVDPRFKLQFFLTIALMMLFVMAIAIPKALALSGILNQLLPETVDK